MKTENNTKTLGLLNQEQRQYDLDPPYQRESGVWSAEKKQLFIDSLINGYDIPKIYLHDYTTKNEGHHKGMMYAVIDGKQRLNSIWEFMNNEYSLSEEFEFSDDSVRSRLSETNFPLKGNFYKDFAEEYKENFKNISIQLVTVVTDDVEDIDELFSRLNNGEPLNSAEKRNAFGGKMAMLVKELANHNFFTRKLKVRNKRFSHLEIAVKILRLEWKNIKDKQDLCDLQKIHLDNFVKENKNFSSSQLDLLTHETTKKLDFMCKVFDENDRLLSKATFIQVYYIFVERIKSRYVCKDIKIEKLIRNFIDEFEKERVLNNKKDDNDNTQDTDLGLYTLSAIHGASGQNSMKERLEILERVFLKWNAKKIGFYDKKRRFTESEREYIWNLNKRKCALCEKTISLNEMDADHINRWVDGGKTELNNARCLCYSCNRSR